MSKAAVRIIVNTMLQASNLKGRQTDFTWTAASVKMKEKGLIATYKTTCSNYSISNSFRTENLRNRNFRTIRNKIVLRPYGLEQC